MKDSLLNMDEVARQPVIDKTELLGHIENELRTYKELGADFDERRHELFGLRSEIMEGKFDIEANRLLIEEREQLKVYAPATLETGTVTSRLQKRVWDLQSKVAEQDKEIQALQKEIAELKNRVIPNMTYDHIFE